MATLLIVNPRGQVLKECTVSNITTMGYAALYVAEALGLEPEEGNYFLGVYPTKEPAPKDDLAADWDKKKVFFCRFDGHEGCE